MMITLSEEQSRELEQENWESIRSGSLVKLQNHDTRLSKAGYCIVKSKGDDYFEVIHLGEGNVQAILAGGECEVVRLNRGEISINSVEGPGKLAGPDEIDRAREIFSRFRRAPGESGAKFPTSVRKEQSEGPRSE